MAPKQRIFADEYIKTRNATRAYMTAYPNVKNENTAHAAASRLLRNVTVSEYIDEQLDSLHNHSIADTEEIMAFLSSMMRGEIREQSAVYVAKGVQELREIPPRNADRVTAARNLARMLGTESGIERAKWDAERNTGHADTGGLAVIVDDIGDHYGEDDGEDG